ncbi:MAG: YkgJ family cysteine cluster protein [Myxococcales bacterium]|nr:YkgJ family cysteine cluster protein [Myxococcales bacterium]
MSRRRRPGGRRAPGGEDLHAELEAVYAAVEARFAGASCPASTECCRFAITGREPYVTSIELAHLRRAIAARGGPVKAERRALPIAHDSRDAERVCPLLGADGRCVVYAARPLGCRTFWCQRAEGAKIARREINDFVRAIQDIAARHQPQGDQGRPLTRALD